MLCSQPLGLLQGRAPKRFRRQVWQHLKLVLSPMGRLGLSLGVRVGPLLNHPIGLWHWEGLLRVDWWGYAVGMGVRLILVLGA